MSAKAPAHAKRGENITLVRWVLHRDGWAPETIEGRYDSRNDEAWTLLVDGTATDFPRSEWELCRP